MIFTAVGVALIGVKVLLLEPLTVIVVVAVSASVAPLPLNMRAVIAYVPDWDGVQANVATPLTFGVFVLPIAPPLA
jgi:hypothetical protein